MIEENSVYTFKEVEKILKITRRTLSKYIEDGRIRNMVFGNKYRFLGKDLLEDLKSLTKE